MATATSSVISVPGSTVFLGVLSRKSSLQEVAAVNTATKNNEKHTLFILLPN